MVTCHVAGCSRPVQDGYVCSSCSGRLAHVLADVPALAAELDLVLGRGTVYGDRVGSPPREAPLPIDPRASEAAWVLRHTLAAWARLVAEERGQELPQPASRRPTTPEPSSPTPRHDQAVRIAHRRCEWTELPTNQCAHCRDQDPT